MEQKIVLASVSPRRKQLLKMVADNFETAEPFFSELSDGDPFYVALTNAVGKGRSVKGDIVIACDTVVALDGKLYGKPQTAQNARETLRMLSGKTHSVISGVYIRANGAERTFSEESRVTFKPLTQNEIAKYIEEFQPLDKAGAYGIQDGVTVAGYTGDYFNIMGLPVDSLREILREYTNVKD